MFADNATSLTTYKAVTGPFQFGEAVELVAILNKKPFFSLSLTVGQKKLERLSLIKKENAHIKE